MSYFCCPNCNHQTEIFGKSRTTELGKEVEQEMEVLGRLPLNASLCSFMDQGRPVGIVDPGGLHAQIYIDIAKKILQKLY
jgi:ATP-binding protein involved in chromosome partitioning